jgi:hypothetical protein
MEPTRLGIVCASILYSSRVIFSVPSCPPPEAVSQLPFCHSVQAKRDTESSIFSEFWMLACVGMTALLVLSAIATQPPDGGGARLSNRH